MTTTHIRLKLCKRNQANWTPQQKKWFQTVKSKGNAGWASLFSSTQEVVLSVSKGAKSIKLETLDSVRRTITTKSYPKGRFSALQKFHQVLEQLETQGYKVSRMVYYYKRELSTTQNPSITIQYTP